NFFKSGKDFLPPRTKRAPLTAAGRSEDLAMRRERGQMKRPNPSPFAAWCCLPLVSPEPAQPLWSKQNIIIGVSTCGKTKCSKIARPTSGANLIAPDPPNPEGGLAWVRRCCSLLVFLPAGPGRWRRLHVAKDDRCAR